jgi:uncharacterized membrane protein
MRLNHFLYALGVILIVIAILLAYTFIFNPRMPDTFTELWLEGETPESALAGEEISFSFGLANNEEKAVNYNYYILTGINASDFNLSKDYPFDSESVRMERAIQVEAGKTIVLPVTVSMDEVGKEKVVVALTKPGEKSVQSVHFWVEVS